MSEDQREQFRQAVRAVAGLDAPRQAVLNLYRALQDAIDLRQPLCQRSGRCCRFDEFGHRLYVTTLEMAAFVHELDPQPKSKIQNPKSAILPGCPFQQAGLCSVHPIRPMGCRVFFCDPTARQWQEDQYARLHNELRRLHEEHRVAYFYIEWREALEIMALSR